MSVIEREYTAPLPPPNDDPPKPTEADVLERAADLLEEFGWCQHQYARTAFGVGVDVDDARAASFCAVGAIDRATLDLAAAPLRSPAVQEFLKDVPGRWFADWNDAPDRTKQEVVSALREAAARARANV